MSHWVSPFTAMTFFTPFSEFSVFFVAVFLTISFRNLGLRLISIRAVHFFENEQPVGC